MKRNVDLTENRFFSNNRVFNNISIDEFDLEHQRKGIIAVGNKKMRAEVKMYRQMDDINYCDCCGKRMNLKPWNLEVGICHKCDNYYQNENDKCKWRKKDVVRNAVIRIA